MSSTSKFGDLKGRVFNRLTVLGKEQKTKGGHLQWTCHCSCGNTVVVTGSNLIREKVKSCGCLQREKRKENSKNLGCGWAAACKYCGAAFHAKSHTQKHCSEECYFLDRLQKNVVTGCIEWMGPTNTQGYGIIFSKLKNKRLAAHRYSWERKHGKIPRGLCVCHKCDNPKCVNVQHLFLGSKYDNNHDRSLKNRSGKRTFTEKDRIAYSRMNSGEKNNSAKLTKEQVLLIKSLRETHTKKELAEMFDVSVSCVKDIFGGRTWKFLEGGI